MSFKRFSMQCLPADIEYCSTRNLISHLSQLAESETSAPMQFSRVCLPHVSQFIFDIAHEFDQPPNVKLHAVGLLEDLITKGAIIYRMTVPLTVFIAAKLNLSYNRIKLNKLQEFLEGLGWEECSTRNLARHEQQILVHLDFKVESRTVLQLVETLLTLAHRLEPLVWASKLFEIAGHMSCLYVLYRHFVPYHLRFSRRHAACALAFAAKNIIEEMYHEYRTANPNLLRILSRLMRLEENRIATDARVLLYIILTKDREYVRSQTLKNGESATHPPRI